MNDVPLHELLTSVEDAGAFRLPREHVDATVAASRALAFSTWRIDLADCRDDASLFVRIAASLSFPAWFGFNWDALFDCLADLQWLDPAGGYVLVFENAQAFAASAADDYGTLVEVLDDAAERWRSENVPFWAFVCDAA
jgi:RNAse (barnase) inhibitor barstar